MEINCTVVTSKNYHYLYLGPDIEIKLPREIVNSEEVINLLENGIAKVRTKRVLQERFDKDSIPPSKKEEKKLVTFSKDERRARRENIIAMRKSGKLCKNIAKKLGVSLSLVSKVANGKR